MKRQLVIAAAIVTTVALLSCASTVEQYQPNIQQGGRTLSLSTNPQNNNLIIAAAETGGLFITDDGGLSWKHLDNFPEYQMSDVKYAPSNPSVIIATCDSDTRTVNGGGIWRSSDGGATWYKPPTAEAPLSIRHPERLSAYGISFEPNGNNVYVGTTYGVAFSTNLGETWVYQVPDSTLPINSDKTQDRVFSILARGNGKVNALGTGGVFYTTDGGTGWHRCSSPGGTDWIIVIHGLAMSPLNANQVFVTLADYKLLFSTDGGQNWRNIPLTDTLNNRPPFIKTARSITGNPNQFDLYFGNGRSLYRKTCTDSTPAPSLWNPWQTLSVDHKDPSDIAFDTSSTNPILLATDGGVHKTTDHGAEWTLTGGGVKGFNALQIYELTGQVVQIPTNHTDLYFGTQDNDVWASSDRGSTWPNHECCEGYWIRTDKYRNDETHSKVTGVLCWECYNFVSNPHLVNVVPWPNAPGATAGPPSIISEGKYVQFTGLTFWSENVASYTDNFGGSWTPKIIIPQSLNAAPQIVTPGGASVIYQSIRRAGLTPTGEPRYGLARIDSIDSPSPTVRDADVSGFGSLGVFPAWIWCTVVGVDPESPDHVIIADIQDDQMKVTTDGGLTWSPDSNLTTAVTDSGRFRFREGLYSEAHAIAFNPFHSNDILVGTGQNGVIRSTDAGHNWIKIPQTEQITNISSFFFENATQVYVSTYGRGLWRLNLTEAPHPGGPPILRETPILIRDPRSGAAVPLHDLGNPDVCPACIFVIVSGGEMMDIEFSGSMVKRILIDKGEVVFVDKEKNRLLSNIEVSRSEKKGDFGNQEILQKIARSGEHIRGLLLGENAIRGIIVSDGDVSSLLVQRGAARLKDETKPYMKLIFPSAMLGQNNIEPGDTLTLVGKGYGQAGKAFKLSVGGKVLDEIIRTDEKGSFEVQTPINLPPGIYKVVLRSAEDGTIVSVDYINVVVRDTMEER